MPMYPEQKQSGSGDLCDISISRSTNAEQEREQFWLPEKD